MSPVPPKTAPTELSGDMIPAIRASIVQKRVWQSIWSLMGWGLLFLFFRFDAFLFIQDNNFAWNATSVLETIAVTGGFLIPLSMVLMSFYGMVTRHPRLILLDGSMVGLNGLWNMGLFVLFFTLGETNYWYLFWGVIQIHWGLKEFKRHKVVASWAKETAHVTQEAKDLVKSIIKRYRLKHEDFFAGRLVAKVVLKKGFFSEIKRRYCGNICPEASIMVSDKMDRYLHISREDAFVAVYKKEGRVDFQTELGENKVKFQVLSLLAWKKWAGVAIIPHDLQRLVREKKLSLDILRVFMRDENPEIRKTVLKLLPRLRKTPDLTKTVGEMFDDPAPAICAAALDVCPKIKAGLLHEKVIPLLQHAAKEVRLAAVRYIASFPQAEAALALKSLMPNEQDDHAYKQMEKALQACQKKTIQSDDSNPYAWR